MLKLEQINGSTGRARPGRTVRGIYPEDANKIRAAARQALRENEAWSSDWLRVTYV